MAQNIYDDSDFFAGYSGLKRSQEGLEGAPEWPALRAMLGEVAGRRVLDLGCGFGWFCRWAKDAGAAAVTGVDLSEKMLARARAASDPAIAYRRADLETLQLAPGSHDLIYASLAFHYLQDLDAVMKQIAIALAPDGRLVFSAEHPMFTAPLTPGWTETDGRRAWPVDHYLDEGPRTTNWLAPGVIKQHRTLATYLNILVRSGLRLFHAEEWGPSDAQLAAWPALADERQRPTFLLIGARKD